MKAKIEPWKVWLAEWQPPYAANQHNHPADCRCCGVNRARGRVALVLAVLDVPIAQITPASLKRAFLRCGLSPSYLDVLCATRKFLRWCQSQGHIPSSVIFEGRRTPDSAQRVLETPPVCPWLLDALAAWKPPVAWHNNFKKSVGLALRQIEPTTITATSLREAVMFLKYSPGYSSNVIFVLRKFLRHLQATGKIPANKRLTIDQPRENWTLPPELESEIDDVLATATGLKTNRPWGVDVLDLVKQEARRCIAWNNSNGARIRSVADLNWRHLEKYQTHLKCEISPRSGNPLKPPTVRGRMIYVVMFWRQAEFQDDRGVIDPRALKKFRLIPRTTPGTRPPIPDEIMDTLLHIDEEALPSMSSWRQFHYFRRKTMMALQADFWGRPEDIPRLTIENVHLDRPNKKGLIPVVIVSGKSRPQGFRETIWLFPSGAVALKRWINYRNKFFAERSITVKPVLERKFTTPSEPLGTPVFPSIKGRPIQPEAYAKVVRNALHAASPEGKKYSAHGIRHHGAKKAEDMGIHLKKIATRLRCTPVVAAQYYLAPENAEDCDNAIWDQMNGRRPDNRAASAAEPVQNHWADNDPEIVAVSVAASILGINVHRLYRAIPKKLKPFEITLPSGKRGTGVRIAEAKALATSLTKGELSDLLFGERKPSNVYKLDLRLKTTRFGGQDRVDAAEAAHLAIERRRLKRRGTLRIASRLRKPAPDLPAQPQMWRLSGEAPQIARNPSLS